MINILIQATLLGGYYALIACGLAFMFQVMRVINLAHGSLAIVSAYLVCVVSDTFGLSPFVALLAIIPVMGLVGWLLQRLVLERAVQGGAFLPVLSAFGLRHRTGQSVVSAVRREYAVIVTLCRGSELGSV